MKQIFKYIALPIVALTLCVGCNDWLDVNPKSKVPSDVLLENEDGYQTALIGAYISMASPDLYGYNTSMYFPEALARHWRFSNPSSNTTLANNAIYDLSTYSFVEQSADTEATIRAIWKKYYFTIAQLNNILGNIAITDVKFTYGNKMLIKGEALGLRAFNHFELLRYFGPVPDANVNGSELTIPYVTEFTKEQDKLLSLTYMDVVSLIEKDLDEAEIALENDPILKYSNYRLNQQGIDPEPLESEFQYFRQNRFNYYAVLGTKARFYYWIGNKTKAFEYATKVIESKNEDQTPKFPLTTEATINDLTMYHETLFSLENPDMESYLQSYFVDKTAILTQTSALVNIAFETGTQASDIRNRKNRYWEEITHLEVGTVNHFNKFTGNTLIETSNHIPIIGLPEIYFIAMECTPSIDQAKLLFTPYRMARGVSAQTQENITDQASLLDRLEKEYRKEFFGEGKMFFYYKKHGITSFTWPSVYNLPNGHKSFVIPKPKSQTVIE